MMLTKFDQFNSKILCYLCPIRGQDLFEITDCSQVFHLLIYFRFFKRVSLNRFRRFLCCCHHLLLLLGLFCLMCLLTSLLNKCFLDVLLRKCQDSRNLILLNQYAKSAKYGLQSMSRDTIQFDQNQFTKLLINGL